MIAIKRVYAPYNKSDGTRILVDRLWPRGLSKQEAHIDVWLKDIAPSDDLRKWFNHDPAKWPEFKKRYRAELKANDTAVSELKGRIADGHATLLFGAKDADHNQAVVLQDYLEETKD